MNLPLDPMTRRRPLAEEVAERLRGRITSGDWPVGARIPTEPELVSQLGVARNTVREAVRALAYTGLLEIRQGAGTYVVATSELAGVMQRRFAGARLRDVNEFRSTLESTAAALAAARRTRADLARIQTAHDARNAAWQAGDAAGFAEADATFHLTVVAAAHNEVLTEIYADLYPVVRSFIQADIGGRTRPRDYVDHSRLVEAIRHQDAATAADEAAAHPHSWRSPGRRTPR